MLFLLKLDQKNKANQSNFSKFEKLRDFLNKVRLVAKKLFYVKKWSTSKIIEANSTMGNILKRYEIINKAISISNA